MMFTDLIDQLKQVKRPEDVSSGLIDELLNASIAGMCFKIQQDNEMSMSESLVEARTFILEHFDQLLLDTHLREE